VTSCSYAAHRATFGNLARRSVGDIDTLTVHEYPASSPWGRLSYRLYRHPIVMFGFGPVYLFILHTGTLAHWLPIGLMREG
jgi:acyl-lipid omega-6 desaturase (Delta-12 desaturase)